MTAEILAAPHRPAAHRPAAGLKRPVDDLYVGHIRGNEPGATLIVVGSLHGNEPAGVEGLRRVFAHLPSGAGLRGEVVGLAGNREALARGCRWVDHDLNRIWQAERVERLRRRREAGDLTGLTTEERELTVLEKAISTAVDAARAAEQPVYVLDLHTTSGGGPSFCVLEDTLPARRLARMLASPLVLGLEEELSGTLTHWLANEGVVAVGFEAGQHEDPASSERAEAAVWLALEGLGIVTEGSRPEVETARRRLVAERRNLPRVVDVRYRHAIEPGDDFKMAPGFQTFHRVRAGQPLALDRHGPVTAPMSGLLLMPLYQAQGDDGFFIVLKISPLWLRLSIGLRRLGLSRLIHLMPGVHKHPELEGSFLVDRRVARFHALDLFHLLGFRRRGSATGRYLTMTRREGDV